MTRIRTLSEFHCNRVFIDGAELASAALLHAELHFKLGLPPDYVADWETLIICLSTIGDPNAHLCRYWEYTPTKRVVVSARDFSSAADIDPTLLMSLAGAVASANDRLRDNTAENRVWIHSRSKRLTHR
jgi:hypothetical protein